MNLQTDAGRHYSRVAWLLGSAIWVLLLASVPTLAQVSTGTILGVVKDASGAAVPQANITVLNVDTDQSRTQMTGDDGSFRVPALEPGHYTVKVEKTGFEMETDTGLTLDVTQQLTLNLTLQVGATQQQVEVTAEALLVNTTNAALGGTVDEHRMTDLPLNGRNYLDLALMQTGVTLNANAQGGAALGGTEGVYFSVSGAPLRSNGYTLDGASMVNMRGANPGQEGGETLGVDGIQEFRVVLGTFDASYGVASGSQIVLVSKGGTNAFHGDVFEYLRNSALDARNYFDTAAGSGGHRLPEFRRNNFGGAFGGPIKKDKTFFYAVYEGLRQQLGQTVIDNVPGAGCHGAAGTVITNSACPQLGATASATIAPVTASMLALYPLPNLPNNQFTLPALSPTGADYGQIRVDHTLSASDNMFGRYTTDSAYVGSYGSGVSSGNTVGFSQYKYLVTSRDHFLTLSENHVFSPTLLNTVRVSYSRMHLVEDNIYPNGTAGLTGPNLSFLPSAPIGDFSISGLTAFGASINNPQYGIVNTYTISDDVYATKGKHAMKFGALINKYNDGFQQLDNEFGTVNFASLTNFVKGIPVNWSGQPNGLNAIVSRNDMYYTFGFYVQDDWRALSRLTVNAGLRYEFLTVPYETGGYQNALRNPLTDANTTPGPMITNPSLKNFQPRLGLAWDVTGNGKLAIRAGFGIYDDVGNISSLLFFASRGDYPYNSMAAHNNASNAVLTLPLTFTPLEQHTFFGFAYHQKQPYLVKYNLSVEQQLPGSMALAVSYVGNTGVHLPRMEEANPEIPTQIVNGIPFYTATSPRPNPNWPSNIVAIMDASSSYNSLQATLNKRLSHGLALQSSYTYSHLLDDETTEFAGGDCSAATGMVIPLDDFDTRYDKGPACYDVTHVLNFNALYHFPTIKADNFSSKLVNGWWVGSIWTFETGYPFTPIVTTQRSLSGNTQANTTLDRVSLGTAATTVTLGSGSSAKTVAFVPYNPNTVITHNPAQWYNPLMFDLGPVGTLGNAGRGILRGPGLSNLTFSLNKDTRLAALGEQGMLQLRFECFNILNHPNFGMPNGTVFAGAVADTGTYSEAPNGTAGQITNTITSSRQIQFALRVSF